MSLADSRSGLILEAGAVATPVADEVEGDQVEGDEDAGDMPSSPAVAANMDGQGVQGMYTTIPCRAT